MVSECSKTPHAKHIRVLALGSRKVLCINSGVQKLESLQRMNERCLDLIKAKDTSAGGNGTKCPYYGGREYQAQLRDTVLVREVTSALVAGQAHAANRKVSCTWRTLPL